MKLLWFRTAIEDLRSVRRYVAQDNPAAARLLVDLIKVKAALWLTFHDIGRPGRVPSTRELVIDGTPYILPYRVSGHEIQILRVLHTSRQWPSGPD